MKRVLLLLVAFMATLATSAENLADKLYANPDLIFSAYRTYIEPCEKIAKAPKGYKPCGMTVYARHGSRYDVDTISLHRAAKALRLAEKEGILTPFGKEVKNFIDEIRLHTATTPTNSRNSVMSSTETSLTAPTRTSPNSSVVVQPSRLPRRWFCDASFR